MRRRRRVFEVTGRQILFALIIASLALTVVFNIGVYVGKKRVINAELEAERQDETQKLADIISTDKKLSHDLVQDRLKSREKATRDTQAPANTNDEKLPSTPSSDQPVKQPKIIRTKYAVKVGTFSSYKNAEKLLELLKSSGYEPRLKSELSAGKKVYHILVGRFDNIDTAKQLGRSLQGKLPQITDYVIKEVQD